MFFTKLVVAIDDSEPARYAVDVGIAIAARDKCPVVFGVMLDPALLTQNYGFSSLQQMVEQEGEQLVANALKRAHDAGVEASSKTLFDSPCQGIIDLATSEQAGMIVMGTHGRTGMARILLGSVAEAVLRRSTIPLCIIRRPRTGVVHRRFLVPVADDDLTRATVHYAIDAAQSLGSSILFCTVLNPVARKTAVQVLEEAERLAREQGVECSAVVLGGSDISKVILDHAYADGSDAIVMASHGREGFDRLVNGSVAEAVIRSSRIPVVVIRQQPDVESRV